MEIREASEGDAAACAAIYASYVHNTAITFELEAPDAAEFARRIAAAHVWLVAEVDGEIVGYAYGGTLKARPAYRFACETTVYLRTGLRRTGAGRALMTALLPRRRPRPTAGDRLHRAAERGEHRPAPRARLPRRRRVGARRLEARPLVGRRLPPARPAGLGSLLNPSRPS